MYLYLMAFLRQLCCATTSEIARTLQTYAQVREGILEHHRSRLLMNLVAQTSANAAFQGVSQVPMDIGALAAAVWKGKREGLFVVTRKRKSALECYERKRKRKRKRKKTKRHFRTTTKVIGLTLLSLTTGPSGPNGRLMR